MIIPIRCFTCNKILGNKWDTYKKLLSEGKTQEDVFKTLGLNRYCCRKIMLTHVELVDKYSQYDASTLGVSFDSDIADQQ